MRGNKQVFPVVESYIKDSISSRAVQNCSKLCNGCCNLGFITQMKRL